MANTYEQIKALVDKGNEMGLSNTIKRDYGIPLDYSSVQASYEAALDYAQNNTRAYIGQPISVGDTLYIVTDEANGYLKAVGTKPAGDDKSIVVAEDGTISIKGFEAAANASLPRKKADGTIEWVAINQIVANDSNTKTIVEVAEGSALTITAAEDAYDGETDTYTYTLDVTLPAIPEYTITKEATSDKVTYTLTKDGAAIGEAIEVEVYKPYDDTGITERVANTEANITALDGRLNTVEDKVDGFFAAVETPDAVVDTLAEIQKYITDDKTGASSMAASIKANADAIDVLNGTGTDSVSGKIDSAIAAKAAEDAGKYATQDALAAVSTKANNAAVKTEVNEALAAKADASALTNYYTKSETYTQNEINDIVSRVTGGSNETAASVRLDLDTHTAQSAEKFSNIETKNANQDTAITANTDAITAINDEATGIYARATAEAATIAQNRVNTLAETTVAKNTQDISKNTADISAINTQIEGINNNITSISGDVGTLNAKTATFEANLSKETSAREELGKTVAQHITDISGLKTADETLHAAIAANTNKFADYSTSAQVAQMISDEIGKINYTAINEAIAANTTAISNEATRADTEEKRLAGLIQTNASAISTNASNIAALETVINAAIENEDGTALNSIKELAVWVEEHETDVLPAIQANTDAIAILNGDVETEGSVQKIVADEIAKIPATPIATGTIAGIVKASEEVTVNAEGVMGIGSISTDKLVQGNNTLILLGGSASTVTDSGNAQ